MLLRCLIEERMHLERGKAVLRTDQVDRLGNCLRLRPQLAEAIILGAQRRRRKHEGSGQGHCGGKNSGAEVAAKGVRERNSRGFIHTCRYATKQ